MRISSNLFFQTGLNSINAQQSDLMHLYQQIGSGQRMVTPADDPLGAAQAVNISQSQSLNKRFSDNREVAKNNLGVEENTLNSVTTLLQDVKTRLIEAGNGTLSDADRATLANVLQSAKQQMLGLANAKDGNGLYLFSGHKANQDAFVDNNGKISWNGDQGQRLVQVDQTRQIDSSDDGLDIFAKATAGSRAYITSAGGVSVNGGTGQMGKPTITDPSGSNIGNSFAIRFTDTSVDPMEYEVSVTDPDGNTVSKSTQIYVSTSKTLVLPGGVQVDFSGTPTTNDVFHIKPALAPATAGYKVTDLATGTPDADNPAYLSTVEFANPADNIGQTFNISFTATQYTVATTDTQTPPVTTTVTSTLPTPLPTELEIGPGITIRLSGVPGAGQSFEVKPSSAAASASNLNIFDTFDDIIVQLSQPTNGDPVAAAQFQNALATAMQKFDVNYDKVLTVRASVGARMNEIEALGANGDSRGLSYTQQLSKLEDVDYYSATAQLQLRTSALEAAALAFKKIQATSLFNMGSN